MTPEPAGNDNDDNGALVGVGVTVTRLLKATVTRPLVFKASGSLACGNKEVFARETSLMEVFVSGLVGDAEMRLMGKMTAGTICQTQEHELIIS